jgi:hypothetical protein
MTFLLVRIGKDDEVVGTDAKPVGFGGVSRHRCQQHCNQGANSESSVIPSTFRCEESAFFSTEGEKQIPHR